MVVEESGSQLLYAMYMNAKLSETFGLPIWLGMDMDENRLLACFSVSTIELTADKLAETFSRSRRLPSCDLNFEIWRWG